MRFRAAGLADLAPGQQLKVIGKKESGETYEFMVNHTFNENQIGWFKAGSALNMMAQTA